MTNATQTVHSREVIVPRLRAYQGSAVRLYKVNRPVIAVVEIHQYPGHGGIVGRLAAGARTLVVNRNGNARDCA
jgi:hypothetical protein